MEITKEYKIQQSRTSKLLNFIENHKFITTVVSMFISFSLLNILLICNFINLLEKTHLY